MFWGLVLEPSKRYTQKVLQSFHISQASLELSEADLKPVQLILEYDGENYVLATLSQKNNIYQVPLDLNFNAGDTISFRTIGKGRVHLTGYRILEDDLEDLGLNGEEESDVDDEINKLENSLVGKSEKLNSSSTNKKKKTDKGNEKESSDESCEDGKGKKGGVKAGGDKADKGKGKDKVKNENDEDDEDEDEDDEDMSDIYGDVEDEEDEEDEDEDDEGEEEEDDDDDDDNDEEDDDDDEDEDDEYETPVKKRKPHSPKDDKSVAAINCKTPKNKNLNDSMKGTPKSEKKTPKSDKKETKNEESSPQKKVLEGGVVIEEIKIGDGKMAKPGKMVQVYYVGRLQSNKKQFDATTQGPGFRFRLGKGEVIRGWDIGVNGMKVGGKRRIVIPANLAYGAKGSPPVIPPNSTLVFEIDLRGVN